MLLADRILYIDATLLAVDKWRGLPVSGHPRGGTTVEAHLDSLRFGYTRRPQPAHRLDTDTSGVLLLARNPRTLARLQQAFEAREVGKTYLAVLDGDVADEGTCLLPLAKVSSAADGWRMVASAKGKPATTRWQRLAKLPSGTLVCFEPETGRTHQLRVHAASGLGAPIVGDPIYGRGQGMMLHAWRLDVPARAGERLRIEAPLPDHFAAAGVTADMLQ